MAGGGFECSMPGCAEVFPSRTALSRHMRTHAAQETREWRCQRCNWPFDDQLALQQHSITSGHLEQPANCSQCGKKFPSTAELETHRRFPSTCSDAYAVTKSVMIPPPAPANVILPAPRGGTKAPSVASSSIVTEAHPAPSNNVAKSVNHIVPVTSTNMPADGHYTIDQLQDLRPEAIIKVGITAAADIVSRSASVASVKPPSTFSSEDEIGCHVCHKKFSSPAAYYRHFLGCITGATSTTPRQASSQQATAVSSADENTRKQNTTVSNSALQTNFVPLIVQGAHSTANGDLSTLKKNGLKTDSQRKEAASLPKIPAAGSSNGNAFGEPRPPPSVSTAGHRGYGFALALHQRPSTTSAPSSNLPKTTLHRTAPRPHSASTSTTSEHAGSTSFPCTIAGCLNSRPFTSQKALDVHLADAHGIGGQALDLTGKDSWILSQRTRNELHQAGHLSGSNNAPRGASRGGQRGGRGGGRGGQQGRSSPMFPDRPTNVTPSSIPAFGLAPSAAPSISRQMPPTTPLVFHAKPAPRPSAVPQVPLAPNASPMPRAGPNSNAGPSPYSGLPGTNDLEADIAQLQEIAPPMMRINLQDDVLLCDDGSIICGGAKWRRMHIANQANIVSDFTPQVHLKKFLWGEYAQSPDAFMDDNSARLYPVEDFLNSPDVQNPRSGLRVVALSCIKVKLDDNLQEVVKIAAVDVATCRILLNHLVCPDPTTNIKDWDFPSAGLASFQDFECARREGYKIFKGWQAARAALWKYIDRETILVGYNIRADLDALRMVHGCAVDVAKAVETAANGPLSQKQLSLDVLCRSLSEVHLTSHPDFGRNALQNAFAIRELVLWCVKKPDELKKWARAKSLDYQRVMGVPKQSGDLPTPAPSPQKSPLMRAL